MARIAWTSGGLRLRAEFAVLYLGAPLVMALVLPPRAMFPALFAVTCVGLWLLHRTPGFSWAGLLRGRVHWAEVAGFAALCAAVSGAVVWATAPGAAFALVHANPALLAMILALYPVLSALPQEVVFRPLFFRRYGGLVPAGWPGIVLNAALFSLAHLLYWNWIVAAMTFAGGLAFARAYQLQQSFPQAVVLHAVAGWVIFTFGLGIFFYTGNVQRPF